jgi:hypothetical protein
LHSRECFGSERFLRVLTDLRGFEWKTCGVNEIKGNKEGQK